MRKLLDIIDDQGKRMTALLHLGKEYARASLWEQAETIAYTIESGEERATVLSEIADVMVRKNEHERLLHLIQRSWIRAKTREDAIRLLPLVSGLLAIHSEIGLQLSEGFVWANAFLQGKTSPHISL